MDVHIDSLICENLNKMYEHHHIHTHIDWTGRQNWKQTSYDSLTMNEKELETIPFNSKKYFMTYDTIVPHSV